VREEDFAKLLDDWGVLRPGALEPIPRDRAFLVFAQRTDARVEANQWQRNAQCFFDTELRFAVPKKYAFDPPPSDAAWVTLVRPHRPDRSYLCFGRPREDDDLYGAEQAEVRQGAAGLVKLAQRCSTVWLVEAEQDEDDALRLSAILASVLLGPILTPDGQSLLGVRSARARLESGAPPYR
jgi:hypothetical protein